MRGWVVVVVVCLGGGVGGGGAQSWPASAPLLRSRSPHALLVGVMQRLETLSFGA